MAFKFNPFTGNFDDVADVAEKLESTSTPVNDNSIVRYDGTDGISVQDSGVTIDDSDNLSGVNNLTQSGYIDIEEISTPSNPSANYVRLFVKDDGGITNLHQLDSSGVDIKLGRDSYIIVTNNTGSTLNVGQIVYFSGASGNLPEVSLAQADSASTMPAAGVVAESIPDGSNGRILIEGVLTGINTSTFSVGDSFYVSHTAAGGFVNSPPPHPNLVQRVGIVTVSNATTGEVQISTSLIAEGQETGTSQNSFKIGDATSGTKSLEFVNANTLALEANPTASRTITIPDATDTIALLAESQTLTNKTLTTPLITTNGSIDVTAAGTLTIGASVGANKLTLGGSSSTVLVAGNLQVDGTTTTVNSTNLEVSDANITINDGGNQASADSNDAGLTVDMSDATNAIIHYDSTAATFWRLGEVGSTVEIADISTAQTLTNKSIDASNNTISNITNTEISSSAAIAYSKLDLTGNIVNADISASAAIAYSKLALTGNIVNADISASAAIAYSKLALTGNIVNADISASAAIAYSKLAALTADRALLSDGSGFVSASSVTNTELGYVSGVTSSIQTQLNDKIEIVDIFSTNSTSGTANLSANETYLVDTSGGAATLTLPAPATDTFVRVKDASGNAEANNITIQQNSSEDIDGASSFVIDSNYGAAVFVSNGTNWAVF